MNNRWKRREIQRGFGTKDNPLIAELWERDSNPVSGFMCEPGNHDPDNTEIDFKRYFDEEYAEKEIEKIWLKSWLFACREEDLPNVGDRLPAEFGRLSFIVIRTDFDEFKAYFNSCRHRGTKLCSAKETGDTIRCPYHGWEWKKDGSLKRIPSHWDFQRIDRQSAALREVQIGRWGGFVYINADPDALPFSEAMGPVPNHFECMDMENRYTAARIRKRVPANWKVCQEAFMESYHVYCTHPEATPFNGDTTAQYDIWASEGGHVGRQSTPGAIPSTKAPKEATPLMAAQATAAVIQAWHYPEEKLPAFDDSSDLRAQLGNWHRRVFRGKYGKDSSRHPDAVMVDSILYFIFPHSVFWLSEVIPFTYSFTPHESDPNKSYFDVRLLYPVPAGSKRPSSSPAIEIGEDELIEDKAPAFQFLGHVLDQDMFNMPLVQKGMKSADPNYRHSLLGTYQESIIQHWNEIFDQSFKKGN